MCCFCAFLAEQCRRPGTREGTVQALKDFGTTKSWCRAKWSRPVTGRSERLPWRVQFYYRCLLQVAYHRLLLQASSLAHVHDVAKWSLGRFPCRISSRVAHEGLGPGMLHYLPPTRRHQTAGSHAPLRPPREPHSRRLRVRSSMHPKTCLCAPSCAPSCTHAFPAAALSSRSSTRLFHSPSTALPNLKRSPTLSPLSLCRLRPGS